MGLFSRKKPPLPENVPPGPWAVVQGSNQGKLLLARVHKGLGILVGSAAYPFRVGVAVPAEEVVKAIVPLAQTYNGLPM